MLPRTAPRLKQLFHLFSGPSLTSLRARRKHVAEVPNKPAHQRAADEAELNGAGQVPEIRDRDTPLALQRIGNGSCTEPERRT